VKVSGIQMRCHPTIIVENSFRAIIWITFIILVIGQFEMSITGGLLAASLVAVILFHYRQWKRTTVQFNEMDIVVERTTLFKLKKTLPYSRIASVNVNRGVINRLFGTSKLMININSGHNAMVPEATLTFKEDVADRLRDRISQRLYNHDYFSEEEEVESIVSSSPIDVIIHGLFSVSTYQSIMGCIFLAYSGIEMYISTMAEYEAGGKVLLPLMMFFMVQILPAITHIIRYYGFKVYRKEDTIYLQHGLIRTYRTSFNIHKINAIRVKSTLFARLLNKSYIEAEVVGMVSADGDGGARPVISLLKNDAVTQRILQELVPEFIYERTPNKQPKNARSVLLIRAIIASSILVAAMIYPSILIYNEIATQTWIVGTLRTILQYGLPLLTALAVLAIMYGAHISYTIREFDAGEELFTFVNGILDREIVVMNYDKVQMVWITKGPIARMFDVAKGDVYMLSSLGTTKISSGYFSEKELNKINDVVIGRIASGKYDHRLNLI